MKLSILIVLLIISCQKQNKDTFAYLESENQTLISANELHYKIEMNSSFRLIPEVHRQDVFNKRPFNISLSAFLAEDHFVMVHAEMVMDTGTVDYSNLTPDTLAGLQFYSKEDCFPLEQSVIDEEHDLNYIANAGFNFLPAVHLKQYFMTSKTGKSELVISFVIRGKCDDSQEKERIKSIIRDLKRTINLTGY